MILSPETITQFALNDAHLAAFRWESEGQDVALDLQLADGQTATLRCTWASAVDLQLSWPQNSGGMPLSWQCDCEQKGDKWALAIDFAANGHVRLECNEARIDYDTNKASR